MKVTTGATFIRIALNISGLYCVSVEPLPLININPSTTMATLIANNMKLILLNAKFFFIHFVINYEMPPLYFTATFLKIPYVLDFIERTCFHSQEFIHRKP